MIVLRGCQLVTCDERVAMAAELEGLEVLVPAS